ncbi:hypothetical protein BVY03_00580, partial [bacterium K02(2017)]
MRTKKEIKNLALKYLSLVKKNKLITSFILLAVFFLMAIQSNTILYRIPKKIDQSGLTALRLKVNSLRYNMLVFLDEINPFIGKNWVLDTDLPVY